MVRPLCLRVGDSVPVREQFLPVAQRRRRPVAGPRLSRVGLADAERVVVPRRPAADARHGPARDAVGAARPTSRVAADRRRRRGVGPRLLHVRGAVQRVGPPAQRHRPRQSQRSATSASRAISRQIFQGMYRMTLSRAQPLAGWGVRTPPKFGRTTPNFT